MDLRKGGSPRSGGAMLGAPFAELGETQVSADQIASLRALYFHNPSMMAARSILVGQLLSSGIVVRRKGEDVVLTESFAKHLEGVWIPFVRQCFDELMVQGYVTVSIENEAPPPFSGLKKRKRKSGAANLTPCVTEPGTCQVSFVRGGRNGYQRIYAAKSLAPGVSYGVDDQVGIFVRSHPVRTVHSNLHFLRCLLGRTNTTAYRRPLKLKQRGYPLLGSPFRPEGNPPGCSLGCRKPTWVLAKGYAVPEAQASKSGCFSINNSN